MSNLKFPETDYRSLIELLNGKKSKTIAYSTTARVIGNCEIEIAHHGNPIAIIRPDSVSLSNAGYSSRTTADRLNRIARSNRAVFDNGSPLYVCIKKGDMCFRTFRNGKVFNSPMLTDTFITFNLEG